MLQPENPPLPPVEWWLTKAQMRQVARQMCPQMTEQQFNAEWARALLRQYRRNQGEKV